MVLPRLDRRRASLVISRATEEGEEKAEEAPVDETTQEDRVSNAMQEFAEAGFPSDEDDAKDPVSRTKAMNTAVDDLYKLMDAEVEVLGEAFDLLGVKGLEKPPKSSRQAEKKETIELEKDDDQ